MSIGSIEKRIERLEERLVPTRNRPFLLSDLPEEKAAELVRSHKSACHVFFAEFGGKPPIEPAQALPIHEEVRYWVNRSVDIFVAFISALERGGIHNEEMIERARSVPELRPWVEWAESCFHKRARA